MVSAGKAAIEIDPVDCYRSIFYKRGVGISLSTKLSMLN